MKIPFMKDKKAPEVGFWEWFSSREGEYYKDLEEKQGALIPEVAEKIHNVYGGLTFQFSAIKENKKREFVISADGIREVIPFVMKLVEAAPELPNWEIIAFRQREDDFPSVELGDLKLTIDDIFFNVLDDTDKIDLDLFIRNYDGSDKYMGAVFILLDNNIGEFDAMTQIGALTFKPLDENEKDTLKPFAKLRDVVDKKKEKTVN